MNLLFIICILVYLIHITIISTKALHMLQQNLYNDDNSDVLVTLLSLLIGKSSFNPSSLLNKLIKSFSLIFNRFPCASKILILMFLISSDSYLSLATLASISVLTLILTVFGSVALT